MRGEERKGKEKKGEKRERKKANTPRKIFSTLSEFRRVASYLGLWDSSEVSERQKRTSLF